MNQSIWRRNLMYQLGYAVKAIVIGLIGIGILSVVFYTLMAVRSGDQILSLRELFGFLLPNLAIFLPAHLFDHNLNLSLHMSHTRRTFLINYLITLLLLAIFIGGVATAIMSRSTFAKQYMLVFDVILSNLSIALLFGGMWALFRRWGGASWLIFLALPLAGIIYISRSLLAGATLEAIIDVSNLSLILGLVGLGLLLLSTLQIALTPGKRN